MAKCKALTGSAVKGLRVNAPVDKRAQKKSVLRIWVQLNLVQLTTPTGKLSLSSSDGSFAVVWA